jgi:hypothetical protein
MPYTGLVLSESSPTTGSTHRKLSLAEWEQVVVLWESGSVTLQDLSDRFGISKPALHEGLKKRGSVKGSRAKEFARHTEDALKSDAQRNAEAIKGFKSDYHKMGDFIMRATIKELQELLKETPRSAETKRRIFTCLKYSSEIFATIRDQKYHLHGLYDQTEQEVDLPEIAVVQYDESEMEAIRTRFDKVPLMDDDDTILEEARAALDGMDLTGL